MTNNPERQFELAWGVHVAKDPQRMTREEIEDSLYSVAEFASRRLSEARTLRNILNDAIGKKGLNNE